ncbi:MAG: cytochrome c oxidase subunit II transmembrane domain-containing protein [Pseudomonadota bacterium]
MKQRVSTAFAKAFSAIGLLAATPLSAAFALPEDKAISLQEAASPIAEEVHAFHNWVMMPIMTGISLFVLGLLLWVVLRYNEKSNPKPDRFSHNTLIEVVWTAIPIVILLFISLFSFDLLFKEDRIPDGKQSVIRVAGSQTDFQLVNDFNEKRKVKRASHLDVRLVRGGEETKLKRGQDFKIAGLGDEIVTVSLTEPAVDGDTVIVRGGRTWVGAQKILGMFGEDRSEIALAPTVTLNAIGRQWGWNYEYPEFGEFEIYADLLPKEEAGDKWLFATTNDVVVPVGETIRIITNSADVIHSWAMPAFAFKMDAVPGRNNESWFKSNATGTYYGQCSEICGKDHAFMPISVRVVTRPEFEAWIDEQRVANGDEPMFGDVTPNVASAPAFTGAPAGTQ